MAETKLSIDAGNNAVLLVHGGAGNIRKERLSPEKERACRAAVELALIEGYSIIESGGSSLDAVEKAVRILEDSRYFNAGLGACLTKEGKIELDAAIMRGDTKEAGAVASVDCVANPIRLARSVMENSKHVLLVGPAASGFARNMASSSDLELVEPEELIIEESRKDLERHLAILARADSSDEIPSGLTTGLSESDDEIAGQRHVYGTVGAVALDKKGNLAAATSTGGIIGKMPGRVGDTPLIGAGTYADNASCAVSATGQGEFFIRGCVAHEVSALVKYQGLRIEEAAQRVFSETIEKLGGRGGLLVLGPDGSYAIPFNTEGMYRGVASTIGEYEVRIFCPGVD